MKKKENKKAIALKYDKKNYSAPHVIAKGSGYIAEKIIDEAKQHDVNILEDKALVQLLYNLELNQQIPPHLYPIIAEVFAIVYRAEGVAGILNER